jgi:hypothetical protein
MHSNGQAFKTKSRGEVFTPGPAQPYFDFK